MISGKTIINADSGVIQRMDCKSLLQNSKIDFEEIGHYLVVGKISPKAGWILHLSGIISQFDELIDAVIPFLIGSKRSFSVIKNKQLAKNTLDGLLGYGQVGKLISVYPENDMDALELAKKLIILTSAFKGPAIPTDLLLKGIVYTLHTTYDSRGEYSWRIPPRTPNVVWPYTEITMPVVPAQKALWNDKYRPLSVIKDDLKGRVIMANYFKGLFNIKLCVIKEGVRNAWSDKWGRDIIERLKWQYELYSGLAEKINTPHIFDFFYENNNAYLVMEYIKGDSLDKKIDDIYSGRSWQDLRMKDKHILIDYLLSVIMVIQELHNLGYVHRDITPVNFLIDKRGKLYLIDMELTYSLKNHKPDPAFRLGTPGYASPEQLNHKLPTVKEDIYALGAVMLYLFTGLTPVKFEERAKEEVIETLCFLSGNYSLSVLISSCLADLPDERPSLASIRDAINVFKQDETNNEQSISGNGSYVEVNARAWRQLVNEGLKGLMAFEQVSVDNQWQSLKKQGDLLHGYQPVERVVQLGFQTGVAGILYLMSRAQKMGYDIEPCRKAVSSSIEFIEKALLDPALNIPAGLYDGSAGISLAIHEGINAGLLPVNTYGQYVEQCYRKETSGLDLANGIAGQGLSLLQCKNVMPEGFWRPLLEKYVLQLLTQQQKDGSWDICRSKRKPNDKLLGLSYGMAGLLYFLIEYEDAFKNKTVAIAIKKGFNFLIKNIHKRRQDYFWNTTTKSKSIERCGCNIGIPGIALVFIKAYKCYGDTLYRKVAKNALYALSGQPVYNDFTQASGLSGLGEVYLEAKRVLGDNEWQKRADWIANLFLYTFQSNVNGTGFWSVGINPDPDPDLFNGSCGIIHFLMRYIDEDRLPYILKPLKLN